MYLNCVHKIFLVIFVFQVTLNNCDGYWICLTKAPKSIILNGDQISVVEQPNESINCVYRPRRPFRNGIHYYEFTVNESYGMALYGLSTIEGLREGMKARGMYYDGYLWNGENRLQKFGEMIQSGDKIGFLANVTNRWLKVYIYHNRHPLGLAFSLAMPFPRPLYPAVKFLREQTVTFSEPKKYPSQLQRTIIFPEEGEYVIHDFSSEKEGALLCSGEWKNYQFNVQVLSPRHYTLNRKAKSSLLRIDIIGKNEIFATFKNYGGVWMARGGESTQPLVTEDECIQSDVYFRHLFSQFENLFYNENEQTLKIFTTKSTVITLKLQRHYMPSAVTMSPFRFRFPHENVNPRLFIKGRKG